MLLSLLLYSCPDITSSDCLLTTVMAVVTREQTLIFVHRVRIPNQPIIFPVNNSTLALGLEKTRFLES